MLSREGPVTIRRNLTTAAMVATIAAAALEVRAGADKIAFPESYAKGVIYMTIDRPNKKQLTEYYVSQDAINAAKQGMPLPSGTTITAMALAGPLDPQR